MKNIRKIKAKRRRKSRIRDFIRTIFSPDMKKHIEFKRGDNLRY
jgi:hypothetical protein